MTHSKIIEKVCNAAPIIPVLTIARIEDARPLAQALVNGGLPALEITLRTPIAMEAIAEMVKVPGALVGVGTLLTAQQVRDAKKSGATFSLPKQRVVPKHSRRLQRLCHKLRFVQQVG